MDEGVGVDASLIGIAAAVLGLVVLVGLLLGRRRGRRPRGRRVGPLPSSVGIRLTTHARERMAQRSVSLGDVERTVRAPDRVEADADEGSVRLERDVGDDVLKVWVVAPWPPAGEAVVKSTAWQRTAVGRIPRAAVGVVVGRGGATIRELERRSGARISVDRASGAVRASAGSRDAAARAVRLVEETARRG